MGLRLIPRRWPAARLIEPDDHHLRYAQFDTCYAVWLAKVDALCGRLLNLGLLEVLDADGLDPYDEYIRGMTPDRYFADVFVTHCEVEQGCSFIDEVIGIEATWLASE